MLTFLAIAVGALSLWVLLSALRPLVETTVVTSADWERLEDESMVLLERRDRLVAELRDLEFEAALNKIGAKDLAELRTRFELEALAVERQLEENADDYNTRIEADVEARLTGAAPAEPEPAPAPAAQPEAPSPEPAATTAACGQCGAALPADARFCDGCGAAAEQPCPACGVGNRAEARFCKGCGHGLEASA